MSKSEYKRLAAQIPDVVKTLRNATLNEVDEAQKKELTYNSCPCSLRISKIIEELKDE